MAIEGYAGSPGAAPATLGPYQYNRTRKDTIWAVVYGACYLVMVLAGFYGLAHRNPQFSKIDRAYLSDASHCPLPSGRLLLEEEETPGFDFGNFMDHTARWLSVSALLSLVLGVAFLKIFQHAPHVMTKVTIVAQVVGPIVIGLVLLGAGQAGIALLPISVGLLWLWLVWLWRSEIELASKLLGVSAHGLVANPHLITSSVLLTVLSILATIPALFTLGVSFMNGEVVPNPERDFAAKTCVDASGESVMCCAWGVHGWVQPVAVFSILLALWTMLLANQVRVFVISGALAQWYFAPPASSTNGTTRRAIGQALGPSFGSLALGSLILTVTEVLRSAADRRDANNQGDIFTCLLAFIADCIASLIEYLTKFATVFMAITGDAFFTAGRRVTDLLVRNLLDTFASTIWFTPLVIQMAGVVLAVCWGCLSAGLYYLAHRGTDEPALGANAAVLGALAGVISLFVLNYLGGVLLVVLDATFVCWALDKDAQQLSQPDIAEVFEAIPLKGGTVVQQPGGGLAYGGVPTEPPAHQTFAP